MTRIVMHAIAESVAPCHSGGSEELYHHESDLNKLRNSGAESDSIDDSRVMHTDRASQLLLRIQRPMLGLKGPNHDQ